MNGRSDLTTENHWIKKFYWKHFFWLNKDIFFPLGNVKRLSNLDGETVQV